MSKRWISMSKKKHAHEGSSLKKLAAGSLTFVKAYSSGEANTAIDNLEDELEAEIERERQSVHTSGLGRLRHRGGRILRSKHVLLCIVLLNMIDCALVLGKLVLDLQHVKDIMMTKEEMALLFQSKLKQSYPGQFPHTGIDQMQRTYDTVLMSTLLFRENVSQSENVTRDIAISYRRSRRHSLNFKRRCFTQLTNFHGYRSRRKRSSGSDVTSETQNDHTTEEILAIACHKLSIIIVCTLLTETLLKVFCFGRHFFSNKLEVFDALIVVASFVVDFVFLNMIVSSIQQFILILAFMLPWGVIRVVNSLVVAVRDHEHFRLKLLYTQKKKTDHENKQLKHDKDKTNDQLDALRRLCLAEGIEEWKVSQSLARQVMKPSKGIMGSFASLALGAIGGGKSNGASIWNLLGTPKMRRGKSEEWGEKLGVNKDKEDTKSLRYTDRVWTVVGTPDVKKYRQSKSLPHQNTVDSDPGTPTMIRGKIKALKRFLKRQDPVDNSSFSSIDTVEKDSKCSLDKMTASEASSPPQSFDYESLDEMDTHIASPMPHCEIISECSHEANVTEDATNGGKICTQQTTCLQTSAGAAGELDSTENQNEVDMDDGGGEVCNLSSDVISKNNPVASDVTMHHIQETNTKSQQVLRETTDVFFPDFIAQEEADCEKIANQPGRDTSALLDLSLDNLQESHVQHCNSLSNALLFHNQAITSDKSAAILQTNCDSKCPMKLWDTSHHPSVKNRSLSLQLPNINNFIHGTKKIGNGKKYSKTTDDIYRLNDQELPVDSRGAVN